MEGEVRDAAEAALWGVGPKLRRAVQLPGRVLAGAAAGLITLHGHLLVHVPAEEAGRDAGTVKEA